MKKAFIFILLIILANLFLSCNNESSSTKSVSPSSPKEVLKKIIIPEFNADSAFRYLETQVDFGPRYISSDGWNNCEKWITNKLDNYADEVYVQKAPITTYDGKNHEMRNIIASFAKDSKFFES